MQLWSWWSYKVISKQSWVHPFKVRKWKILETLVNLVRSQCPCKSTPRSDQAKLWETALKVFCKGWQEKKLHLELYNPWVVFKTEADQVCLVCKFSKNIVPLGRNEAAEKNTCEQRNANQVYSKQRESNSFFFVFFFCVCLLYSDSLVYHSVFQRKVSLALHEWCADCFFSSNCDFI